MTHTDPTLGYQIMALVAAVWLGGYVTACLIWPLRACRKCQGAGRFWAQWGARAWRACPRCDGSGTRPRTGRRIYNYFRAR